MIPDKLFYKDKALSISEPEPKSAQRVGFMAGENSTPDDFDSLGASETIALMGGKLDGADTCRI